MKKAWILGLVLVVSGLFTGCNPYNTMVEQDEAVKTAWAQVENAYQRRADLIDNLVATVKGFAEQEKEVLVGVTEARAKLGGVMNVDSDLLSNPQQMQQFQEMQGTLSGALQRLMVVVEQYPVLKSDQNFLNLQAQLEGTENRISVERRRYNEAVQTYNTNIRSFPWNFLAPMWGFTPREPFKAQSGAEVAPKVEF